MAEPAGLPRKRVRASRTIRATRVAASDRVGQRAREIRPDRRPQHAEDVEHVDAHAMIGDAVLRKLYVRMRSPRSPEPTMLHAARPRAGPLLLLKVLEHAGHQNAAGLGPFCAGFSRRAWRRDAGRDVPSLIAFDLVHVLTAGAAGTVVLPSTSFSQLMSISISSGSGSTATVASDVDRPWARFQARACTRMPAASKRMLMYTSSPVTFTTASRMPPMSEADCDMISLLNPMRPPRLIHRERSRANSAPPHRRLRRGFRDHAADFASSPVTSLPTKRSINASRFGSPGRAARPGQLAQVRIAGQVVEDRVRLAELGRHRPVFAVGLERLFQHAVFLASWTMRPVGGGLRRVHQPWFLRRARYLLDARDPRGSEPDQA